MRMWGKGALTQIGRIRVYMGCEQLTVRIRFPIRSEMNWDLAGRVDG